VSSSHTEAAGLVEVTMPQMGVSVAEGTVVEWRKRVGDWVQADETICEISTDKIDSEVPAPASGRVTEILVEVGATVPVETLLARIDTAAAPGEPHADEHVAADAGAGAALEAPPRRYSPVVQRIAAEHGIDLDAVHGTGRGGRVRKQDVLAFIESGGIGGAGEAGDERSEAGPPMHIESPYRPDEPAPPKQRKPRFSRIEEVPREPAAPAATGGGQPLSRMRQAIGRRMVESLQTAATCTTMAEADMSRIEAARRAAGFSYLPYQARATVETLQEFPYLNATLDGEDHTVHESIHLGIAVSLGEGGLIVPVIHDAQDLSVEGLGKRIKDLAVRARNNQLQPDEVRGGTFTITNPGPFGSIMATPVINLPQVGILDTESVVKRAVVVTDELGNDSIAIRPMTYLCLSWDHRALDGAYAAQFLSALRKKLESWPITGPQA
jgi:pyruvate/2-oxoglutarate dehydrogenase complex dihydrolipoamide acyltransferase (E2) component